MSYNDFLNSRQFMIFYLDKPEGFQEVLLSTDIFPEFQDKELSSVIIKRIRLLNERFRKDKIALSVDQTNESKDSGNPDLLLIDEDEEFEDAVTSLPSPDDSTLEDNPTSPEKNPPGNEGIKTGAVKKKKQGLKSKIESKLPKKKNVKTRESLTEGQLEIKRSLEDVFQRFSRANLPPDPYMKFLVIKISMIIVRVRSYLHDMECYGNEEDPYMTTYFFPQLTDMTRDNILEDFKEIFPSVMDSHFQDFLFSIHRYNESVKKEDFQVFLDSYKINLDFAGVQFLEYYNEIDWQRFIFFCISQQMVRDHYLDIRLFSKSRRQNLFKLVFRIKEDHEVCLDPRIYKISGVGYKDCITNRICIHNQALLNANKDISVVESEKVTSDTFLSAISSNSQELDSNTSGNNNNFLRGDITINNSIAECLTIPENEIVWINDKVSLNLDELIRKFPISKYLDKSRFLSMLREMKPSPDTSFEEIESYIHDELISTIERTKNFTKTLHPISSDCLTIKTMCDEVKKYNKSVNHVLDKRSETPHILDDIQKNIKLLLQAFVSQKRSDEPLPVQSGMYIQLREPSTLDSHPPEPLDSQRAVTTSTRSDPDLILSQFF